MRRLFSRFFNGRGRSLTSVLMVTLTAVVSLFAALSVSAAAASDTRLQTSEDSGEQRRALLVLTQGLSPLDLGPEWFTELTKTGGGAASYDLVLASYRPASSLKPVSAQDGWAKLLDCRDPVACSAPDLGIAAPIGDDVPLGWPAGLNPGDVPLVLEAPGHAKDADDLSHVTLPGPRAIFLPPVTDPGTRSATLKHLADLLPTARAANQPILVVSYADTASVAQPQLIALIDYPPNLAQPSSGIIQSPRLRTTGLLGADDVRDLLLRHVTGGDTPAAVAAYFTDDVPEGGRVRALPTHPASPTDATLAIQDTWLHARAGFAAMPAWFALSALLFLLTLGASTLHFWRRPTASSPTFIWRNIAWLATFTFATTPAILLANALPWWRVGGWMLGARTAGSQATPALPESTALASPATTPASSPHLTHVNGETALGGNLMVTTTPVDLTNTAVGIALVLVIAALLTLLARRFTRHPVAALATLTLGLLAADLVGHIPLMRDSLTGYWTMQFARLYGATNRTFMILTICGLLAILPFLTRTKSDFTYFAAVGTAVVAVDALPQWGADFGGPLGIIGAFAVAALLTTRTRLAWWHPLAWIGASAVVMMAMGAIDLLRPYPSHIGAFWRSLFAGQAGQIVQRKALAAIYTVAGTPLILLGVLAAGAALVGFVVWARKLALRPGVHRDTLEEAAWGLPVGSIAAGVGFAALCGAVFNDSGMTIVADALLVGGPAFIAVLAGNLVQRRTQNSD